MKKILFFIIALCAVSMMAFAQTNVVTATSALSTGLATSSDALWSYAISALTPVLVWLATIIVPKLPKPILPMVTPFIGVGLGIALNALAGTKLTWVDMTKAGALAVFVRETFNQAITKQLAVSDTTPAPVPPTA